MSVYIEYNVQDKIPSSFLNADWLPFIPFGGFFMVGDACIPGLAWSHRISAQEKSPNSLALEGDQLSLYGNVVLIWFPSTLSKENLLAKMKMKMVEGWLVNKNNVELRPTHWAFKLDRD